MRQGLGIRQQFWIIAGADALIKEADEGRLSLRNCVLWDTGMIA